MRTASEPGSEGTSFLANFSQCEVAPAAGHERLILWVSLLWSGFFFITPYYKHSLRTWLWFALFYAVFLLLYFGIAFLRNRWSRVLLGLLFLLGYMYFPFNHSAGGVFVYPAVILPFVIREPRAAAAARWFALVVGAQIAAIFLEVHLLGIPLDWAESITFYIIVLGLSNFAYSRQMIASDQLKLANQEIERLAQTAERERIARDLHDLLGHTLTVIAIKADLANRVFATDAETAQREISDVEQTARRALAEVREAVAGYRGEGLQAEIARARRTLTAAGVQLTTNIEPMPLGAEVLNTLCLVLREAVTNIVRHARATTCVLEISRTEAGVRLSLADNGKAEAVTEGNGLCGMRERVAQLHGQMILAARAGAGLRLTVDLPWRAKSLPPGDAPGTSSPSESPVASEDFSYSSSKPHLPEVLRA